MSGLPSYHSPHVRELLAGAQLQRQQPGLNQILNDLTYLPRRSGQARVQDGTHASASRVIEPGSSSSDPGSRPIRS
jgi:hypothetical protein